MKLIDVWVSGCFGVVFAALTEYCIVLYLAKDKSLAVGGVGAKDAQSATRRKRQRQQLAAGVERMARLLLPVGFLAFCVVFWASG